jgi:outer membrane lipoprotein SlyB
MKTPSKSRIGIIAAALIASGLAACAPQTDSRIYAPQRTMQASNVQYGTVSSMRYVEVQNVQNGRELGAIAGGIAGAMIGDQFGKGRGNTLATGAGAIAGAMAGSSMADNANRHVAQEWFVKLENGRSIAVIQNDPNILVGARVAVVTNGSETRLVP